MRRPKCIGTVLGAAALVSFGCRPAINVEAERTAVLERDRAWAAAARESDPERVFPYWTDDAVIYAAGMPAVRGKDAIRKFVAGSRARGLSMSWEPLEATVSQAGDLGYTVGSFQMSVKGPDGAPAIGRGTYLSAWRKSEDGVWRCTLEIHSPSGGAADPPPESRVR